MGDAPVHRESDWPTRLLLAFTTAILLALPAGDIRAGELPQGFVHVDAVIPDIRIELRYSTSDNFVGRTIDGYRRPAAILTREAAAALRDVQRELAPFGLGLKIFDAYRPQQAVDCFVNWAGDMDDQRMKARYYPDVDKGKLLAEGYIASRSGHSRGSTVDLTIVALAPGFPELDMGTPWDFFGSASWPDSPAVSAAQRANRLLLREVMTKHGFVPLAQEWWHFTLAGEPFPDTYFNFPVR